MIHLLDILTVRAGHLDDVHQRVRATYAPLMASTGMALARLWTAPALELHDQPTELVALWELPDTAAFWRWKRESSHLPAVLQFWHDVEPLLAGRSRRIMADPDDRDILR